MIDFVNKTDFIFDLSPLETIAKDLSDRTIEFVLTDDQDMREINKTTRGADKPTDVLSFPIADFPFAPLGSIAISIDAAKRQARGFGHSAEQEIAVLFLHGILHLLGFDHETDNGEMSDKESALRKRFNLPLALTERQN
ncbi:MAG: rRNA maturation RNase YbeY [Helicobacteraceae bacterium]|jgi:probable rRNA maturation factor|nr:rRNA maturation RNase YbeY [Helicobacteraceae bacterium]